MKRISLLAVGILSTTILTTGIASAGDGNDNVGVVDSTTGIWYLRDGSTGETTVFYYGRAGDIPFMGDWDCDGVDTPGLYRQSDGFVYLRNSNSSGWANHEYYFGRTGDYPIAGDFDGDGCDTVSVYRESQGKFFIINELTGGWAESEFVFGKIGDKPFAADFDDDGTDTIGLHRESTGLVYFKNELTGGWADTTFVYGRAGDRLVAGDWAERGSPGVDSVGVFRPSDGMMYLKFANSGGPADLSFRYGNRYMYPVAGDFGVLPGGGTPPPGSGGSSSEPRIADHTYVERYGLIPTDVVDRVSDLNIYYGHTSHGSQLVTGVETMPSAWQLNNLYETAPDLGTSTWNIQTDTWLSAHPETEVVVWSWCGQQSSNSVATVQAYLDKMSALEAKYPNVTFIYMTGHLRGAYEYFYEDAENMVLQRNNQMVRDYAEVNGKWLFDFADIESYLDGSSTQCMYHGMPVECTWPNDAYGCAHSRMGNCDRKGKAFYVLLAEIVGWEG